MLKRWLSGDLSEFHWLYRVGFLLENQYKGQLFVKIRVLLVYGRLIPSFTVNW